MGTKMKGFFKGLKYITQIFEDEKEEEMQIGNPTDVKHVAHIGYDGGPAVNSAPSWMDQFQSGEAKENPITQGAPQDSGRKSSRQNSPNMDSPDQPKSSSKESSTKSRSRRPDSSKPTHKKDPGSGSESKSRALPDIPRKTRRKKSKDQDVVGGSSRPGSGDPPVSDPVPTAKPVPGSECSQFACPRSEG